MLSVKCDILSCVKVSTAFFVYSKTAEGNLLYIMLQNNGYFDGFIDADCAMLTQISMPYWRPFSPAAGTIIAHRRSTRENAIE